jgi:hypothetical protein
MLCCFGFGFNRFDQFLSAVFIATFGGELPAFAKLFPLCKRCVKNAWTLAWIILCVKTYWALQSMGRTNGGSGAAVAV